MLYDCVCVKKSSIYYTRVNLNAQRKTGKAIKLSTVGNTGDGRGMNGEGVLGTSVSIYEHFLQ